MAKLTKRQLNQYRKLLLQLLEQLGGKLEHMEESVLRSEADAGPEDGDDFGDGGSIREFQLGLIENEVEILEEVRDALDRIRAGEFGNCLYCNELIPVGRLEVRPYARFCLEHQRQHELGQLDIDG